MSKSIGNVVDPNDVLKEHTSDALRYFALREGIPQPPDHGLELVANGFL